MPDTAPQILVKGIGRWLKYVFCFGLGALLALQVVLILVQGARIDALERINYELRQHSDRVCTPTAPGFNI